MSEDTIDEGQLHSDHIAMMRSYRDLQDKLSEISTKVETTLVLVSKVAERQQIDQERTEREMDRLRNTAVNLQADLVKEREARNSQINNLNTKINMGIGGLTILAPLAIMGLQMLLTSFTGGGA